MSRPALLYLLLVVAPAGLLGWFAFRVADGEFLQRMAEHRGELERDAQALGRRIEDALLDAMRRALEDGAAPVGFARNGQWLGFTPASPDVEQPTAEERKLYEVSMRGGESFEHALRDPDRALDAYAFYLPRIHSKVLRARLRLGSARSAAAADQRRLAGAMLRDLSMEPVHVCTEEGLPVALAALRVLGEPTQDLERVVAAQRSLARAVEEHPEVLAAADALLDGEVLLFARKLDDGRREIRRVVVELPSLSAPGRRASLSPAPRAGEASSWQPDEAGEPVRLGAVGPVLAAVRVQDLQFGEKRRAATAQRDLLRGLVVLLVAVTLAGGVALTTYLTRERRLARLRAQLLANVSHELKTPVTSIRLFAEMLADDDVGDAAGGGADPERSRRYGRHLASEGQRLSQLVENLLDVSRLGRKEVTLAREPVDLAALLRRVADGFAFQAREKHVAFAAGGLDSGEVLSETNAPAVERIVLNMLDNAVKYHREKSPSVTLRLEKNCAAVSIIVADNGIGIPRRDQERVFEEFYRVRYDDYAVKGSGLGLSIARRLARKLGGDVTLESKEGAGSTFTLVLPAPAPIAGEVDDARTHPDR